MTTLSEELAKILRLEDSGLSADEAEDLADCLSDHLPAMYRFAPELLDVVRCVWDRWDRLDTEDSPDLARRIELVFCNATGLSGFPNRNGG
jgi:hypothetical protein